MKKILLSSALASLVTGCAPVNKSEHDIMMENYIRVFPHDIVKTEPGCLKPDFTNAPQAIPIGAATIRVTFTSSGKPLKSEIVQSSGNSAQNKLISDAFMKCNYEKDPLVKIPDGFQRDYSYSWNDKPFAGLNRCMFGSHPYPMRSMRNHEEGVVLASYFVNSKTNDAQVSISQSSGFELLDNTTKTSLANCLVHDSVKADLKKDERVPFRQVWKINNQQK